MNDDTAPLRLGAKQSRIVASAITLVALCVLFALGAAVFWLAMSVVDRYRLVLLPPIVKVNAQLPRQPSMLDTGSAMSQAAFMREASEP